MTITDLIKLASNKLAMLNNQRNTAVMSGDTSAIEQLDIAIDETQTTLNKLHTLE
jgi:hypothetical protein